MIGRLVLAAPLAGLLVLGARDASATAAGYAGDPLRTMKGRGYHLLSLGPQGGDEAFNSHWDLVPGRRIFAARINPTDLTADLSGDTGYPPMFGGVRAFNGPTCTP